MAEDERRLMPRIDVGQRVAGRVEDAEEEGHVTVGRKLEIQLAIEPCQRFLGGEIERHEGAHARLERAQQQRCRRPLAGDIAEPDSDAAPFQLQKIVRIAADGVTRDTVGVEQVAGDGWGLPG